MYQPDEALAAYEIPTARETTDAEQPPIHGCPDDPGRECMMRYLWARKKNQAIKCAHCGIIAARISNFYKAKERAEGRARAEKEVAAKVARARKAGVQPRKKKPAGPITEEERARRREVALANLAKGRATIAARAAAEHKPQLTEQQRARKREIALANLAKGEARRQEILAEGRRLRAENMERMKAERAARRAAQSDISVADRARQEVTAEMQRVRDGQKNPSRVQGVVLILEWCLQNGVERLSVLDFTSRFNALKGSIDTKSGVMGRSLRRYGLHVRQEYNADERHNRVFLYVDEVARQFVADEFVFHTHAKGRIKR